MVIFWGEEESSVKGGRGNGKRSSSINYSPLATVEAGGKKEREEVRNDFPGNVRDSEKWAASQYTAIYRCTRGDWEFPTYIFLFVLDV